MKNPNRWVTLAVSALGLAAGALPAVANLDWSSTAGVVGGAIVVLGVATKWLTGWQQWEALQATQPAQAAPVEAEPESELAASTVIAEPFKGKVPKDKGNARAVRKTR
jgi:protein-S-isoprenylcysteine O-methyltransferase Ste14